MSEQCVRSVSSPHSFRGTPCSRKATVEENGKWYCWQHAPKAERQRLQETQRKWQTQWDAKHSRQRHQQKCTAAFAALAGHLGCDPSDLNVDLVKWHEALEAAKPGLSDLVNQSMDGIVPPEICERDREVFKKVVKILTALPEKPHG